MRRTADFLLENIKAKDNAMTFLTFWKKKIKRSSVPNTNIVKNDGLWTGKMICGIILDDSHQLTIRIYNQACG